MKKFLAVILTTSMLSLTACGGSAPSVNDSSQDKPGTETTVKDSLIWAQPADVTSLDPHKGKETPAVQVTCNIFDTLLRIDKDGTPLPWLAESFENVDPLTWKFKLREDVKFQDGSPMTADDVKFSLDRAKSSPAVQYIMDFIDQVTKEDDYNITIVTKMPYSPILANLAVPYSAILPKALVEANEETFFEKPIGTGAYKFVEWRQGEYVKLEANPDYFAGKPATKYLQMKVVLELSQRMIALETGEVDFAYDIAPNDVAKVEENADLELLTSSPLSLYSVAMNMNKAPFDNEKVRQAVRYAINQDDIIQAVRYGKAEPAASMVPPAAFGYSTKSLAYPFDIEKAKALLTEAGFPDGFSTTLWVNDNQERIEACQILKAQLKKIGIEVELQVLEFGTFIERTEQGEHDLCFLAWSCSSQDADYNYYGIFHSTQQGIAGNRAFIGIDEVDQLIEAGRSETDPAKRQAIYDQLEELLGPIAPYAPICYYPQNVAIHKSIQNFQIDPNAFHRLYTVSRTN